MRLLQKKQHSPRRRAPVREGRATVEDLNERYAFRRNRTLTGSLSSGVASANEQRSELRSARVQTHDLRRHRRKLFGLWVAASATTGLLGCLIYESIALPVVTINGVSQSTDAQKYEKTIQMYLNGRFLERSRLTLDVERLAAYLQANGSPEVESVSSEMSFAGLGATRLNIIMRRPVVSWKTGDTQLYVDMSGVAFQANFYAPPSVQVVDQTGVQAHNNRVLASNRFLSFIGRMIGSLSEEGYRVTQVVLPENTARQILVSVEGVAYPIKFSVDRPTAGQAQDAARAIRHLAAGGIGASYLDVRVSGRAYYR